MSAILSAFPGAANGQTLNTGQQLGVSRAYPPTGGYEFWSVWAGRSDGNLVSLREHPTSPTLRWTDHGAPFVPVGSHGVSATGWTNAGSAFERAYYVNGNLLVEHAFKDRNLEWIAPYGPPAGKTIGGALAATWRLNGATREPVVFVVLKTSPSAQVGDVYAVTIPNGNPTWRRLTTTNDYSATQPIAASNVADGSAARAFLSRSGQLWTIRWKGGAWLGVNLLSPAGSVCATVAAAEGNLGGIGYRLYVFCTRTDLQEVVVRYRYTNNTDGTGGWSGWQSLGNLAPARALNSGYALAATARPGSSGATIELYVLATDSRLFVARHRPSDQVVGAFQSLGDEGEFSARFGGLAATPVMPDTGSTGFSFPHYLGPIANAGRLYRRNSLNPAQDTDPWNWGNHGPSVGRSTIASTGSNTENSTAFWRGRVASTVLTTSPTGINTLPASWLRWSNDDGETWPTLSALPVIDSTPFNANFGEDYASDPSVAFDDSGKAWIALLGVDRAGCGVTAAGTSAYYATTTDGVNFTVPPTPLQWDTNVVNGVPDIDHPWVAVYQDPVGPDRVHFVWGDANSGAAFPGNLMYASSTNGQFQGAILNQPDGNRVTGAAVPYVTVGALGATYVAWNKGICRINPNFNACEGILPIGGTNLESQAPATFDCSNPPDGVPDSRCMALGQSSTFLWVVGMQSWVASPSDPNRVYYAFQRKEPGTGILDVYFTVLTYSSAAQSFSPSNPIAVYSGDGFQQFGPELTVTQDVTGNDTVFISWYDMRDGGAGACNQLNRCYRTKRAVLFSPYISFQQIEYVPFDLSNSLADGFLLPSNCNNTTNSRFLGDFHHTTADRLHSFHVAIGANPGGGVSGTGILVRGWVSRGFYSW